MGTLKPQTSGPLYSNTVIGSPPRSLLAVPNVTAHHQRPVYQLHTIQGGNVIVSAL